VEGGSAEPKRKRAKKASTGGKKAVTIEDRITALEKHAAEAMEEGTIGELCYRFINMKG
jgi:hypothetical protein